MPPIWFRSPLPRSSSGNGLSRGRSQQRTASCVAASAHIRKGWPWEAPVLMAWIGQEPLSRCASSDGRSGPLAVSPLSDARHGKADPDAERLLWHFPRRTPPARLLSRLLTMQRDQLSKVDVLTVAAIEVGVPALAAARDLLDRFHRMLRGRSAEALAPWLADTEGSPLASLGKGISADLAAVKAALTEPWSSGQTEGQITKLKLVKRQMYGRGGLDLLCARLVRAEVGLFRAFGAGVLSWGANR